MIGVAVLLRTRRHSSTPLMPGIIRSVTIRSGLHSSKRRRASSGSLAARTSYPWAERAVRSTRVIWASSSTTRTRSAISILYHYDMIATDASLASPAQAARRPLCGDDRSRPAGGADLSQDTPREPDYRGAHLPGDGAVCCVQLGIGLFRLPVHRLHPALQLFFP